MVKYQAPRGTRDLVLAEASILRKVIDTLKKEFRLFGFCDMETPAFEHMDTLSRKAGEFIEKEIYSFRDKADRPLGLIFEFTASLARVLASRPDIPRPFKRYQVGKVWRYESPQTNRFREFFQADIDIIGPKTMDCEFEVLSLVAHVLSCLGLKDYTIILHNRKILHAQMEVAGVEEKYRDIVLRGLDKLDKVGWDKVYEYALKSGVIEEQLDRFKAILPKAYSNSKILKEFRDSLKGAPLAVEGIAELEDILNLSSFKGLDRMIQIIPTLVRGLDYYTGSIFEVRSNVLKNVSFGGGGRYDNLIKLFGGSDEGAVGFAFGVDRLVWVLKNEGLISAGKTPSKVFIGYQNENFKHFAHELANYLRLNDISTSVYLGSGKLVKQMSYASKMGFIYTIVVGEEEAQTDTFKVRDMNTGKEVNLPRSRLPSLLYTDPC